MQAYLSGEVDSFAIVFPRFINTILQRPETLELLPVEPPKDSRRRPSNISTNQTPRPCSRPSCRATLRLRFTAHVLELAASFQSAQMVAMRNATDAAEDLVRELTLLRNKVRQEQITKELLDITGGVEALSKA